MDNQGRSILKLRDSRGVNAAHLQRSQELWARANLIQQTVANYISTTESKPGDVQLAWHSEEKSDQLNVLALIASQFEYNEETQKFDKKPPRGPGRSRPPPFNLTELLLKQEYDTEHAVPISREDLRVDIKETEDLNDEQ